VSSVRVHSVIKRFCNSACHELHAVTVKESYTELKMILDGQRNFAKSRMHFI